MKEAGALVEPTLWIQMEFTSRIGAEGRGRQFGRIRHDRGNAGCVPETISDPRNMGWARGLATEIATSLLELAREKLELESIIGITTHPNLASQLVLRKVGFEEECDVVVKGTNCRLFRIRL